MATPSICVHVCALHVTAPHLQLKNAWRSRRPSLVLQQTPPPAAFRNPTVPVKMQQRRLRRRPIYATRVKRGHVGLIVRGR